MKIKTLLTRAGVPFLATLAATSMMYAGVKEADIGISVVPAALLQFGLPVLASLIGAGTTIPFKSNKGVANSTLELLNKLELEIAKVPHDGAIDDALRDVRDFALDLLSKANNGEKDKGDSSHETV